MVTDTVGHFGVTDTVLGPFAKVAHSLNLLRSRCSGAGSDEMKLVLRWI